MSARRRVSSVGVNRPLACAAVTAWSLFGGTALAQQATLRLIDRGPKTESPPPATFVWPRDFAAASAAAQERHVLLLLYFTAKW